MDLTPILRRFDRNRLTFAQLLTGVGELQARHRPEPNRWNLLEVVNHLVDEETLDFRARIDATLHRPGEAWTPIDPVSWVQAHRYDERDFEESLQRFLIARQASVEWLKGLERPVWGRTYSHPKLGDIRAGDLLSSWLFHDYLHLRQVAHLSAAYVERIVPGFDHAYAGKW